MSAVEIGYQPASPETSPASEPNDERRIRTKQLRHELDTIDSCLDLGMGPNGNEGRHPLTKDKSYEELLKMYQDRKTELTHLQNPES